MSLLVLGDLGVLRARDRQPAGHRVADLLELGDAENPRPARGGDAPFDAGAGEGGAEKARHLGFHAGDLAAQLVAGAALVGLRYCGFERGQDIAARCNRKQLLLWNTWFGDRLKPVPDRHF